MRERRKKEKEEAREKGTYTYRPSDRWECVECICLSKY